MIKCATLFSLCLFPHDNSIHSEPLPYCPSKLAFARAYLHKIKRIIKVKQGAGFIILTKIPSYKLLDTTWRRRTTRRKLITAHTSQQFHILQDCRLFARPPAAIARSVYIITGSQSELTDRDVLKTNDELTRKIWSSIQFVC